MSSSTATLQAPPQQEKYKLEIRNLSKVYEIDEGGGKFSSVTALKDVSLSVREGEFVSLIGPSGCGKSTVLMIVAGLYEKTEGEVLVDNKTVSGPGLDRGVVFQEFALFPWMNVEDNICFGLEMKGFPKEKQREIARRYIKMVGLEGFEHVYPFRLSGGMKQRVAVAHTLAYEPAVLLMDEPFGALDAPTRAQLQQLLANIWRTTGATIIFVTHSIREALFLSQRVVVMSPRPGRVQAIVPVDLPHPRDPWSPEFIKLQRHLADLLGGEESGFF